MTSYTSWERTVQDSVAEKRLDAEHFDPSYEALETKIKRNGAMRLNDLVTYCRRGQQPEYIPGGDVLVLNSEHVGEHFINLDGAERTSSDFYERKPNARATRFDILMNSTGVGTIGRVNCMLHEEPTVVDNHVTVIRAKSSLVDPVYLTVFLNSPLGRQQTYKWQSGSSGQLEIYPDDIRRFWVCVPDDAVQKAVRSQFERAYKAYRDAAEAAAAAAGAVVAMIGGW